ncbi:MAG: hypothetical protein JNG83_12180 [Opitutaceae bacterium]|nr:hypothetical protein [Opitutaceae bacterium]
MTHPPTPLSSTPDEDRLARRNGRLYIAQVALIYLSAPVLYVSFVHTALIARLGGSDTVANLPGAIFYSMAWVPMLAAWLVPEVRRLKATLATSYLAVAAASAVVAVLLLAELPASVMIFVLAAHGAMLGAAVNLVSPLGWEILDRGMPIRHRGRTLGLAFGWGPLFAVVGSLAAQLLLRGNVFGWEPARWPAPTYPYNYALLFGGCALTAAAGAALTRYYQFSTTGAENVRENFRTAVVNPAREFWADRELRAVALAYLLVFSGLMAQNNLSMFSRETVGRPSEELAGYQLTLQFSFKVAAGFALGWLLMRTNPKAPMLVTISLLLLALLWALNVPGQWYLLAFGLNGAGELFGVYSMNYAASSSDRRRLRFNMAFLMLVASAAGIAPLLYGRISDAWGLRASFYMALAILASGWLIAYRQLPTWPRRQGPAARAESERAVA